MKATKQYLRQLQAGYDVAKGSYNYCLATKGTDKEIQHYKQQMEAYSELITEVKRNLPGKEKTVNFTPTNK